MGKRNPLIEVQKLGQSIWLDNISRGLITSGELRRMVEEDGLSGVTSNPAIFEKALATGAEYDPAVKAFLRQGVEKAEDIFERLAIEDIRLAADILYPVYLRTEGCDGYVSMEVSPHLAHDTKATIDEARRLNQAICRENVMIKVPGTPEGIPAIRTLIADGVNVNVTLLFSVDVYEQAAQAFMEGLQARAAEGDDISRVASVASFFVSRIDTLVDKRLAEVAGKQRDKGGLAESLAGRIAVANGKLAYRRYLKLYETDTWKALEKKGARPQRLLWASTSTKNPKYSKTLYVDELIAPNTVNTVPDETFQAFKSGGTARMTIADGLAEAEEQMKALESLGVSLKKVTEELLDDGVQKFCAAFDNLVDSIGKKRASFTGRGGGTA